MGDTGFLTLMMVVALIWYASMRMHMPHLRH
jgi:hypothetical protein